MYPTVTLTATVVGLVVGSGVGASDVGGFVGALLGSGALDSVVGFRVVISDEAIVVTVIFLSSCPEGTRLESNDSALVEIETGRETVELSGLYKALSTVNEDARYPVVYSIRHDTVLSFGITV